MRPSPWLAFAALATQLAMTGCTRDTITMSGADPATPGEGVAFGRVKVLWNGEEKKYLASALGGNIWSVVLLADGTSTGKEVDLNDDGSFAWHLPPGGYVIAGFHGWTPTMPLTKSAISGRVFAHFSIAAERVTYIGTLALAFQGAAYRMSIEDDAEATQNFSQRFPNVGMPIAKGFMVLEHQQ